MILFALACTGPGDTDAPGVTIDTQSPGDTADTAWVAGGSVQFVAIESTFDVAPTLLTPGDFDGDGHTDLLVLQDGTLALLVGTGDGRFEQGPASWATLPQDRIEPAVAEHLGGPSGGLWIGGAQPGHWDDDGVLDLMVSLTVESGSQLSVLVRSGGDVVVPEWADVAPGPVALPDVDGDGLSEVLHTYNQDQILYLSQDGTQRTESSDSFHYYTQGAVSDLDGDGALDVAFVHNGGFGIDAVGVCWGPDWSWTAPQSVGFAQSMAWDPDEVVLNDGSALYQVTDSGAPLLRRADDGGWIRHVADFNGDGHLDALVDSAAGVAFWTGDGQGALADERVAGWDGEWSYVAQDLTDDGWADLLLQDGATLVLLRAQPLD